jgi:hypothetical protein
MNFKLKFQTSAPTSLEPNEIIAEIQLQLSDTKYNVDSVTANSVSFSDNPWRLRWNFEAYMLDEAEFVISNDLNGKRILTLNYYWRYYQFLIWLSLLAIMMIPKKEYVGILFFAVFYAIVIPIDVMRAKSTAREILRSILRADA